MYDTLRQIETSTLKTRTYGAAQAQKCIITQHSRFQSPRPGDADQKDRALWDENDKTANKKEMRMDKNKYGLPYKF